MSGNLQHKNLGKMIEEYGTLKKLRLFINGFEYEKGGTLLIHTWEEIDYVNFYWEEQETLAFSTGQSLDLAFYMNYGNKIKTSFSWFSPLYGIGNFRATRKIKELLSTLTAAGIDLREKDWFIV